MIPLKKAVCLWIALMILTLLPGMASSQPPTPVPELNLAGANEFSVTLSRNGLTLILESTRVGGTSHLFVANRLNRGSAFGPLAPLCGVNSGDSDGQPWLSWDGLRLYFASTRCSGGPYPCLYVASRPDPTACFGTPAPLDSLNLPPYSSGGPTLTPDELTIFFNSDRPGGSGGADIWYATRANPADPFGQPQPVPNVNSPAFDGAPDISADGRALYFHSDRAGGVGGFDIWLASRPSAIAAFGPPVNLSCVNWDVDDIHPAISPDGLELYLGTMRGEPSGQSDIWRMRLPVLVNIPATSPWVDSGVDLSGGEAVCLKAVASWQPDPGMPPVGPMGRAEPCDPASPSCPIHANHGSLVARIDTFPPFVVGESFQVTVNPAWSGRLQFMINDDVNILYDNAGWAKAWVRVTSCVEGSCVPVVGVEPTPVPQSPTALGGSFPNPFLSNTRFRFRISEPMSVSVRIYDMAGRVMRVLLDSASMSPGERELEWDGRGSDGRRVPAGVYFYALETKRGTESRKMVFLR